MAEEKKEDKPVYSKSMVTPIGRLRWCRCERPIGPDKYHKTPTYETELIIDASANLDEIKAEVKRICIAKWGADVDMMKVKKPFKSDDKKGKEYIGKLFIKAHSNDKPAIVGRDKKPLPPDSTIYDGCYARLMVTFATYNMTGENEDGSTYVKRGITSYLNLVQKTGDGERFGGSSNPDDLPDDLPPEEEVPSAPAAKEDW